jgi:hypothetical protein
VPLLAHRSGGRSGTLAQAKALELGMSVLHFARCELPALFAKALIPLLRERHREGSEG